jgi:hypothetical protein
MEQGDRGGRAGIGQVTEVIGELDVAAALGCGPAAVRGRARGASPTGHAPPAPGRARPAVRPGAAAHRTRYRLPRWLCWPLLDLDASFKLGSMCHTILKESPPPPERARLSVAVLAANDTGVTP